MDEAKREEIIKMLLADMSVMAISQEMGISAQTVRNAQKTSPEAQAVKLNTPTRLDKVAVVEEYEAGKLIPAILEEHNISRTKLYQILSKYSVPTRQTVQKDTRKRAMDEACAMYQQGWVIRQITADTGIHQPSLHEELARRGIPLRRPRKHANKP